MQTFAEYLAGYRLRADKLATPVLTNEETRVLCLEQNSILHGRAMAYQYIGDDAAGAPVYRLGTCILLQDISVQLTALETAGTIRRIAGADAAYSTNLSLR